MSRLSLLTSMVSAIGWSHHSNRNCCYMANNVPQPSPRQRNEHLKLQTRCDAERVAKAAAKRVRKAARKEAQS